MTLPAPGKIITHDKHVARFMMAAAATAAAAITTAFAATVAAAVVAYEIYTDVFADSIIKHESKDTSENKPFTHTF